MDERKGRDIEYSFLSERDASEDVKQSYGPTLPPYQWSKVTFYNIILFVASACMLLGSIANYYLSTLGHDTLRETTYYSTVFEDLPVSWGPRQFHTRPLEDSIYRQPPSEKVDKAWQRITDIGVMHVSRESIIQLGKDPEKAVRAPESWGYGSDRYLVHLDGIHLVHCLDSMRKSFYYNFEYYHPNGTSDIYRAHLSHCLDTMLHRLLCQPSVELISYNWVAGQKAPYPDFDINHQCWDFEHLMAWQERHRIPHLEEKWDKLTRPDDTLELPYPLLILESYNITEEEAIRLDQESNHHTSEH